MSKKIAKQIIKIIEATELLLSVMPKPKTYERRYRTEEEFRIEDKQMSDRDHLMYMVRDLLMPMLDDDRFQYFLGTLSCSESNLDAAKLYLLKKIA